MSRISAGALLLLLSLFVSSCGSNNSSTSNTPAPTATSSTPPPPPSSGGSGTTSGGSGSSGSGGTTGATSEKPQSYSEAFLPIGAASGGVAEVNPSGVNNQPALGRYSLTLAAGSSADSYSARFCPFASGSCMTFTDAPTFRNSGGVQLAGTFPGHGAFSGEFIISKNGADASVTGFTAPPGSALDGNSLQAQLVRASEVSGGLGGQIQFGIGTDPLSSGSAVVSQPSATINATVAGASAVTTYTISYCDPAGANCAVLGTLTTDASGNGNVSMSVSPAQSSGNVNSGQFKLSRSGANGPVEFVSGFVVP